MKRRYEDVIVSCFPNQTAVQGSPFIALFLNSEIFGNRGKRHICDAKNSILRHVLPIPEKDKVILSFREGFIIKPLQRFPT